MCMVHVIMTSMHSGVGLWVKKVSKLEMVGHGLGCTPSIPV